MIYITIFCQIPIVEKFNRHQQFFTIQTLYTDSPGGITDAVALHVSFAQITSSRSMQTQSRH